MSALESCAYLSKCRRKILRKLREHSNRCTTNNTFKENLQDCRELKTVETNSSSPRLCDLSGRDLEKVLGSHISPALKHCYVSPSRQLHTSSVLASSTPVTTSSVLSSTLSRSFTSSKSLPIVMVVTVQIKPEAVKEFLQVMKVDTEGSRAEPGCLGFDVLRDLEKPNTFHFYEVYKDQAALAFHKKQPHYLTWADWKQKSGGVVSQSVIKSESLF
eukprot:g29641.t1